MSLSIKLLDFVTIVVILVPSLNTLGDILMDI